jgi:single-strand DNA-binding protein
MNSVNQVFLSGTAGKDAEFRAFASGTSIATFSIAASESRKDAQGNWKMETTWLNVKTFGRLAERARDEVKKGTRVFLEGKLTVEAWDDKKTGEKRSKTVIIALFLSVVASARASEASMDPAPARARERPPALDRLPEITAEDVGF